MNQQPSTATPIRDDKNLFQRSSWQLCSYLPDRASQLTFMLLDDNQSRVNQRLYSQLSQQGFRRSGTVFYKPNCQHCQQCIASRVPVNEFTPSRRFRRVLKRNQHLAVRLVDSSQATEEHYALYQRYICARHADGDMYPPSLHTFEQFLVASPAKTLFMEVREANGKLVAVAVTDQINDGLSSIYTFFDPDPAYSQQSLGVYCILKQIETAKLAGLDFLYLGFWIPTVKNMSYKVDFAPIQLLIDEQWQHYETTPDSSSVLDSLKTLGAGQR